MKHPRGVTLIEVMVVVAIIGALAGLATVSATTMVRTGRVNGSAAALARLMGTARARAMAERCPYVLEINGPEYDASAAPADVLRLPAAAILYRKGVCTSVVPAFEPGLAADQADRVVDKVPLGEFHIELEVPAVVLAAQRIDTGSVSFSWNALGQRGIAVDPEADGVSTPVAVGADVTVRVLSQPVGAGNEAERQIVIPLAGRARLP